MSDQSVSPTILPTVPVVSSAAPLPAVSVSPPPAPMQSAQPATTAAGSSSASPLSTAAVSTAAATSSTIAQATAAPQRLNTQYGVVLWPSLPGMQQAAVGVAPPPPSMAGSGAPIGRVVEVTGRGGILTAPGTAGMASPGVPGMDGSGSLGGSMVARGRRSKPRASNAPKKDDPKVPDGPPDRDTMVVLRSACDACHRMKRKCDGLQPCNRCRRRSRPCGYSYKQKSGPPKGSKRKLIAADEDLLENRQARPKLLPIAMWPQDAERDSASQGASAVGSGTTVEKGNGGAGGGGNAKTTSSSGSNGINRLLAVGGHSQPRLPGISIPTEDGGSNGTGSSAGAAVGYSGSAGSSASTLSSAGPRLSSRGAARGGGISVGGKKRAPNPRPIADLVLPIGAAQLSLEARAGAYKKAQEAAAAGMAAARAYVEGEFPTDERGEFVANQRSSPTAISQSLLSPAVAALAAVSTSQKQGIVGRIASTAAPAVSARSSSIPSPASAAAGPAVGVPSSSAGDAHENPAPLIPVPSLSATAPTKGSVGGLPPAAPPPPAAVAAAAAAAAAASAAAQQAAAGGAQGRLPAAPAPSSSLAPPPQQQQGQQQLQQQQKQQQHQHQHQHQHPAHAGMPPQGAMPPGMTPPVGMPMPYHPQYGMYHSYSQSLYATYLAQYQLHQGINPYDGMYDAMNPYGNPAMYGPGVAAAAAAAAASAAAAAAASAAGSPAPAPASVAVPPPAATTAVGTPSFSPAAAPKQRQGPPSLPGVTGKTPPFAVTEAAAVAIAAATRGSAGSGNKPKESEEAKQVAVETLLGLKNAQGSKGGEPVDEASAQAMAAVTAAAVSAAAAAAQEAAANATAAGADDGSAATAAAAAAATAKAVAQAVAAARGIAPEEERSPTMGSRFDTPLGGDEKETTAAAPAQAPPAPAAVTTAVEDGKKPASAEGNGGKKTDEGTTAAGAEAATAAAVNGNGSVAESAQAEPKEVPTAPQVWAPVHGGPEEAASEAPAGREEPEEAPKAATSMTVVPLAGGKRDAAELSCSDDVTAAEATSKRGRTVAPSV